MPRDKDLPRREFMKLCVTAMAAGPNSAVFAVPEGTYKPYQRSRLVDGNDEPLRAQDLIAGENYIFHYPFVTTPCFLLDVDEAVTNKTELRTEDGRRYQWQGGIGPKRSIVAFSAICAHKMTHPARSVSFINYRHERVKFHNSRKQSAENNKVIFCCSERSVYDVRNGARVLGGPAKQPLAAIVLAHDPADDALYATGTYGGEMFENFFAKFGHRLQLEYEITDIDRSIGEQTRVLSLDQYCKNQILC